MLHEIERRCDYDDASITENTRAAYPLSHIPDAVVPSVGDHPQNIILLTADAFGVLPPVARLTRDQALYHFISGYTAKVAGTERGVTEPSATFSTCFGAPFLPLPSRIYAQLLGEKLEKHGSRCWLINTGWTGGPYGVGKRIHIGHTRAMVRAALTGVLDEVECHTDPVFGLPVPLKCPDVPDNLLDPRSTWSDPDAYDRKAGELATAFNENFTQFPKVNAAIRAAGPRG